MSSARRRKPATLADGVGLEVGSGFKPLPYGLSRS
jgi:hypothetical protein